jgi:hypothetical protein
MCVAETERCPRTRCLGNLNDLLEHSLRSIGRLLHQHRLLPHAYRLHQENSAQE